MTTIIPALSLFIGLKYYELISISHPITPNHKMILYGALFLIAILSNIFTLYIYLNGNVEVLKNIQLLTYTIMCWCLFIVIVVVIDLPETHGMVQPFSNTFGYFYVKKNADTIINNMLSVYENSPDHEIKRILRQINSDNSLLLNSMSLLIRDDLDVFSSPLTPPNVRGIKLSTININTIIKIVIQIIAILLMK